MPFEQFKLDRSVNQSRGIFDKYIYKPDNGDLLADILSPGYFLQSRFKEDWVGGVIEIYGEDGYVFASIIEGGTAIPLVFNQDSFLNEYLLAPDTSYIMQNSAALWCLNDNPATVDLSNIESEGNEVIILARNAPVSIIGNVNSSTSFTINRQYNTAHLRYSSVTSEWGLV